MKLVFIGAPGAGKGTHAQKLCKEFDIPHVSTGDILREAVSNGTEVGLSAKSYMDKGELVPDSIVVDIVAERLKQSDCSKGFLLDGYPRTLVQAQELDAKLAELDLKIDKVLSLAVTEKVVIERLTGRRLCSSCGESYHVVNIAPIKQGICDKCGSDLYQREDDKEETILNRLAVFKQQSMPLIEYYKQQGLLTEIMADGGIDEVFKEMLDYIKLTK